MCIRDSNAEYGGRTTSKMDSLLLASAGHCKVHPSVVFTILDHHSRRKEGQERVIGTLLGSNVDGVIEIQNCFPVPHNENEEQVAVDMEFHHNMYKLHQQVNKKEEIVGWYATGTAISEHSAVIHEFYGREGAPVHLLVDATLSAETDISARAFVASPVTLGEQSLGMRFKELCAELVVSESEQVGLDMLLSSGESSSGAELQVSDIEGLELQITEMLGRLTEIEAYVADVQAGKREADPALGRLLADTVALVPNLNPGMYEKTFHNGLQDLLMVVYLANLTRTQLALAERIQAVV
eukprot:TRINITY_DN38460_c0_g1_i1.p1 TRINITY_DN38460_c0_g1~~TRINITY_DN38460_c0_g1_i1.p1  ORF type:complete len:296 (-),score=87.26 TRINITY_DN38460_c0_g1_i1:59-946(-)